MVPSCVKYFLLLQIVHGAFKRHAKDFKVRSVVQHGAAKVEWWPRLDSGRKGGIPRGQKIGILIRGATFRAQFPGERHDAKVVCDPRTREVQIRGTTSLIKQVVEPFEVLGNQVHIVSTAHPCRFNQEVRRALGGRPVIFKELRSANQSHDLRMALDVFSEHYGGVEAVPNELDYVLVVRHDLQWLQNITHWANDFDAFSFLHRCNPDSGLNVGGSYCVHDIVHWMPSKLFPIFDATIGHSWEIHGYPIPLDCFEEDGHACYYPMKEAFSNYSKSAHISFISPLRIHTKRANPLVNLCRYGPDPLEGDIPGSVVHDDSQSGASVENSVFVWLSVLVIVLTANVVL